MGAFIGLDDELVFMQFAASTRAICCQIACSSDHKKRANDLIGDSQGNTLPSLNQTTQLSPTSLSITKCN